MASPQSAFGRFGKHLDDQVHRTRPDTFLEGIQENQHFKWNRYLSNLTNGMSHTFSLALCFATSNKYSEPALI